MHFRLPHALFGAMSLLAWTSAMAMSVVEWLNDERGRVMMSESEDA